MWRLDGYTVGGTVHVVVNNQVGFTTSPRDARSTTYATDVARMLQMPVFHVNGEDLEAVAQVVLLAVDFRQRFHRDVVIDIWCLPEVRAQRGRRAHLHPAGDVPGHRRPSPSLRQRLGRAAGGARGALAGGASTAMVAEAYRRSWRRTYAGLGGPGRERRAPAHQEGVWEPYRGGAIAGVAERRGHARARARCWPRWAGALTESRPRASTSTPRWRSCSRRGRRWRPGQAPARLGHGPRRWPSAPWPGRGTRVRLSGQDVRRGHLQPPPRRALRPADRPALQPLAHLRERAGRRWRCATARSPRPACWASSTATAWSMPEGLVIWEAQFGDFVNARAGDHRPVPRLLGGQVEPPLRAGAGCSRTGWRGRAPSTPAARLERFLALAVDDNWQVMNLTTPAQMLPRAAPAGAGAPGASRSCVMAPKSLLRHPAAVSPLDDLAADTFRAVLPDAEADPGRGDAAWSSAPGKVYYDLAAGPARAGGARGGARAGRAALPPGDRRAARHPVRLPRRLRGGLGAGGAAQHGGVGVRGAAPVAAPARQLPLLAASAAPRPPARPPARPPGTSWSSRRWCSRPSTCPCAPPRPAPPVRARRPPGEGRGLSPGVMMPRASPPSSFTLRGGLKDGHRAAVPSLGESVTQAMVGAWLKKEGEPVALDEAVVEVESEKATVAVPAPAAGVLRRILKPTGETVDVGEVLAELEEGAAAESPAKPLQPLPRDTRRRCRPAAQDAPAPAAAPPTRRRGLRGSSFPGPGPGRAAPAEGAPSGAPPQATSGAGRPRPPRALHPRCAASWPSTAWRRPRSRRARWCAARTWSARWPGPRALASELARARPARAAGAHDAAPAHRGAPAARGAGQRRHPHHLQRARHVAGHRPARAARRGLPEAARREARLHVVLREGGGGGPARLARRQRRGARRRHPLQGPLRHRRGGGRRQGAGGAGAARRRRPLLRRDREAHRRAGRQGAREPDHARTTWPAGPSPSATAASTARCSPPPS